MPQDPDYSGGSGGGFQPNSPSLLRAVNQWWTSGSTDREALVELLAAARVPVTFHELDVGRCGAYTDGRCAFQPRPDGSWLLLKAPGDDVILAAPCSSQNLNEDLMRSIVARMFRGANAARSNFAFDRLYEACRLRPIPGEINVYRVEKKGSLRLVGEPMPESDAGPVHAVAEYRPPAKTETKETGPRPGTQAVESLERDVRALKEGLGRLESVLRAAAVLSLSPAEVDVLRRILAMASRVLEPSPKPAEQPAGGEPQQTPEAAQPGAVPRGPVEWWRAAVESFASETELNEEYGTRVGRAYLGCSSKDSFLVEITSADAEGLVKVGRVAYEDAQGVAHGGRSQYRLFVAVQESDGVLQVVCPPGPIDRDLHIRVLPALIDLTADRAMVRDIIAPARLRRVEEPVYAIETAMQVVV